MQTPTLSDIGLQHNHQSVLPQHRPSACERFKPFISRYILSHPIALAISPEDFDQQSCNLTTFIARFRDAINAIEKYNWFSYDVDTLGILAILKVSHHDGKAVVGTTLGIKLYKTQQRLASLSGTTTATTHNPQPKQNEFAIISRSGVEVVCSLLNLSAIDPQPLFYTDIHLTDGDMENIAERFPNVMVTKNGERTTFL